MTTIEPFVTLPAVVGKGQTATMLGTSIRTVERLLVAGKLRGIRVGGQTRVCASSLKQYLERGTSR